MSGTIHAADLFCGAGGASAGLFAAARHLKADVRLVAVNHWPVAIETHQANYPGHIHYCQAVGKVSPREAVPGGRLTILVAGPSCTWFSQARGAKPINDQARSSVFDILDWCRELSIENVLIENVPEFIKWGPLHPADHPNEKLRNRPDKSREGAIFREFIGELRSLGYTVEWRILNAAHFGDPTTRRRLFIQARKSGRIVWPKPSHHAPAELAAYPETLPWRPARDIIDWSLPSQSIFSRKKRLRPATERRIAVGLRRICGLPIPIPPDPREEIATEGWRRWFAAMGEEFPEDDPEQAKSSPIAQNLFLRPFLVVLRNNCYAKDLDEPLPSMCTSPGHFALVEPFLIPQLSGAAPRSVKDPLNTITATGTGNGLVQPFLVGIGGPTGQQGARSIEEPMRALLKQNHTGLCQPFLVRYNGGDNRVQPLDGPLTTLDASNRFGLCEPFLVSYYGQGEGCHDLSEPLDTVTARDRFALVQARLIEQGAMDKGDELALLDIHFRMLQPHELAAAHSFPKDYHFAGGREDKVRQIGNSWPVSLSTALCKAILSDGGTA
jgi:DNA (cytosine-5)-methyltransferase 1